MRRVTAASHEAAIAVAKKTGKWFSKEELHAAVCIRR